MSSHSSCEFFDVVIVGGGPAGMSAALVLGRCLRKVLVCDAGNPRNSFARIFNGYLSRDGSKPEDFREICRQQLRRYETVELRVVKVVGAERGKSKFMISLESGVCVDARMLLLTTGLVDELPDIPNFKQFYGKTVHNCPYCDGWEHRRQAIAVAGGNQDNADLAIELLIWSKDVVLCSNGPLECDEKARHQLKRSGIQVIETPIARLEGTGDMLEGVRFTDGSYLSRDVLFCSPGQHQRSLLAEQLGCEFCEKDGYIQCGEDTATCVPGVYAAGNASRGVQLVIAAAAEGTLAAVAINNALLEADAESGLLASGRGEGCKSN